MVHRAETPPFEEQKKQYTIEDPEMRRSFYREVIGLKPDENPDAIVVVDAGVSARIRKADVRQTPTAYRDALSAQEPPLMSEYKRYRVKVITQKEAETGRETVTSTLIGSPGGKARELAGLELAQIFPEAQVITTSRYPSGTSESLPLPSFFLWRKKKSGKT